MDDVVEVMARGMCPDESIVDKHGNIHEWLQDESRAKAQAALSALTEAGWVVEKGWQPIETAPRDGTPILGGFWSIRWADSHRVGQVVKCWYQPEFDAFISAARVMTLAPGLTFDDGKTEQVHSPVIEPVTQWMTLHPYKLSAAPAPK